jgi:hypothetical protein|tara:strand:+ start:615 stop:1040 length:426 start_codon:yes stop_codon:yes gene_type:complete
MKRKKNSTDKSKTSKAKTQKKPLKTSDLSQTHGKVEEEEFTPTTLDQIWGDRGDGKYGTLDEGEYIKELDDMSLTDMHAHAAEVGIIPIDSRDMLEKRLIKEFNKHVNAYRKPNVGSSIPTKEEEMKKIPKKVWDILKEGR